MTILLCDVGGTHIRFAVSEETGAMSQPEKLRVDLHHSLEDAVSRYLLAQSIQAGNVTRLYLAFSNRNNWKTEEAMLRTVLPNATLHQVNDFEANALGILAAPESDFEVLFKPPAQSIPRASKVVLGVGTGLGLAYVSGNFIQRTHGGHMLPVTPRAEHSEIFAELAAQKSDGTASIYEDVLSGPGLFNLYRVLCNRNHLNPEYHDTGDLLISGKDDPVMQQALRIFHEILGLFAHQAVAFGYSYGGIYLTGGIIDKLMIAGLFNTQVFLENFRQKNVPVVQAHVMATPLYWIRDEFVSLRGLLRQAQMDRGL